MGKLVNERYYIAVVRDFDHGCINPRKLAIGETPFAIFVFKTPRYGSCSVSQCSLFIWLSNEYC